MKTVKISMIVDDDLTAWGPGAVGDEMQQYHDDYEFAAQCVGARIFDDADDVTVDIDFVQTMRVSAWATVYEDDEEVESDIDMDNAYDFSRRVWDEFCVN